MPHEYNPKRNKTFHYRTCIKIIKETHAKINLLVTGNPLYDKLNRINCLTLRH